MIVLAEQLEQSETGAETLNGTCREEVKDLGLGKGYHVDKMGTGLWL